MSETPKIVKDLLDQLIQKVTGIDEKNDARNFKICQKFALQKIKNHKFGRPNHFEIARMLGGYIERYSVLDKEPIGAALASRLDELQNSNFKFAPELLTLLLDLADKPFENDEILESLERIPKKVIPRQLTWDDIIRDDPLEGDIWDDIDYGAESDLSIEDDGLLLGEVRIPGLIKGKSTTSSIVRRQKVTKKAEQVDIGDMLGCFVVPIDENIPEMLGQRQYWTHPTKSINVPPSISVRLTENSSLLSELDSVREVLLMLGGYESTLFHKTEDATIEAFYTNTQITVTDYALQHAGNGSFRAILRLFAQYGTALTALRNFIKLKETLSTRQAFVGALSRKLKEMRETLAKLQSRFVENQTTQMVSLMELQSEIERYIRPYLILYRILPALNSRSASLSRSAPHLDALYSSACTAQMTGDMESYKFFHEIFFASLNSYLRPIREWMESGELQQEDADICFIKKHDQEVLPSELWEKQYSIIQHNKDGVPEAPSFILPFVEKIFTTGKSVVFLRKLINYEVPPVPSVSRIELDMSSIYTIASNNPENDGDYIDLAPFEQLFSDALSTWISKKHNSVGSILRNVLYHDCGLLRCLSALDYLYLMRDGHLMDLLTTTVLSRLTRDAEMWNDRFLITELLQSIFSPIPEIDTTRISARRPRNIRGGTISKLASISFEYTLPWPIANVLPPSTLTTYHQLFTFLFQLTSTISLLSPLLPKKSTQLPPPLLLLRHRILTFARTILTYITSLILLPQSNKLRDALEQVKDVEGMINVHRRYTKRIREMCLLGEKMKPVKKATTQILGMGCEVAEWYAIACKRVGDGGGIEFERGASHGVEGGRRRERKKKRLAGRVGLFAGIDTETEGESTVEMDVEDEDVAMEETEEEERKVREMDLGGSLERLEGLCGFVRSSLKGVSRAGVMPHFDLLAEEL